MSHSSTSSGTNALRRTMGGKATWYAISERAVLFLHPFTLFRAPLWWEIIVEVFHCIQFLSFGFDAVDFKASYYFAIPRAFVVFNYNAYSILFWCIFSSNVFLFILLFREYWTFGGGLKHSKETLIIRILRFWIHGVLPITFLPMLHICMRTIACDDNGMLAYFDYEQCWEGRKVAEFICMLLVIPALFVFKVIRHLTKIRFILREGGIFVTPYVYQELLYLLAVSVFTLVSEGLTSSTNYTRCVTLSLVMIAFTSIMLTVTIYYLPYIRMWDNCLRSAMIASLLWFAICDFFAAVADAEKPLLITFGASVVPVSLLGLIACRKRAIYLYWNKEARDFEHQFEVEIAVRVCYMSTDPDHIEFANDILHNAMQHFTYSSMIHIAKVFVIVNQPNSNFDHPALSHHMDRAYKETSNPFLLYLAYTMKVWRRHSFQKEGAEEDTKRQLKSAEKLSKKVIAKTRAFWKLLLKGGGDLSNTGLNLVSEIEAADSQAEKTYKYLISHYPNSAMVFRHYANFLKEVHADTEGFHAMLDLAEEVEEKNTRRLTSSMTRLSLSQRLPSPSSISTTSTVPPPPTSPYATESEKSRVIRRREKYVPKKRGSTAGLLPEDTHRRVTISHLDSIAEDPDETFSDHEQPETFASSPPATPLEGPTSPHTHHESLSNSPPDDINIAMARSHRSSLDNTVASMKDEAQMARYKARIAESKYQSVRNLKIAILAGLFLVAATVVITYVTPLVLTTDHYTFLKNMPIASGRVLSASLARSVRENQIAASMDYPDLFALCHKDLKGFVNSFKVFLSHYTLAQYAVIQDQWGINDVVIELTFIPLGNGTYLSENITTNLYYATTDFMHRATRLVNLSMHDMSMTAEDPDFLWIMDNVPTSLVSALGKLSESYAKESLSRLHLMQTTIIWLCSMSGVLLCIIVAFFFIFPYRAINAERRDVLRLFSGIPRSTIQAIYDRLSDVEESNPDDNEYERSASLSLKLQDMDQNNKDNRQGSMRSLGIRYVIFSVLIYGISVAIFLLFTSFINKYGEIGTDINSGIVVRFNTQLVGYYANELIYDKGPYTRSQIRVALKNAVQASRQAQYSLDYGTSVDGGQPRLLRSSNYSELLTQFQAYQNPPVQHRFYPNTTVLPELNIQVVGLFDYLNQFWAWVDQLILLPDDKLTFENIIYRQISSTIVSKQLDQWLAYQCTWLAEEYDERLHDALRGPSAIFVIAFFVLGIGLIYIYPLTNQIALENSRTMKMLLFIPLDIINHIPAIKEYLSSGEVKDIRTNLQETIEEFQNKTKTILEGTTDAVIMINHKGRIDYFNNSAEKLFEYRVDEVLNQDAYNILPSSLEPIFKQGRLSNSTVNNGGIEAVCRTRTGKEVPALISFSNCLVDNKVLTAVFVRDITELVGQRKRTDELMRLMLPNSVAESLKRDPDRIIAKYYKSVTVLFADICGFTELSSRIEAPTMVAQLNDLFTRWDLMVEKHNLEKIKTVGDAIMVVGGAPEEMEHHAEVVFLFARDMFVALEAFNRRYSQNWQIRIGINSGPAVAGVVGKKKITYDLWSDDVNLASRMESTGVPMHIQVSANTYELLKHKYATSEIRTVDVKGKGKMVAYLYPPT